MNRADSAVATDSRANGKLRALHLTVTYVLYTLRTKGKHMLILLILLLLVFGGGGGYYGYSHWGVGGGGGILLLVVLLLFFFGRGRV
jgi:hypothetical protein